MNAPKVLKADEHRVGFTVTTTQATFKKLMKLAGKSATMDDWSAVVTRLIEKAEPS